MKERGIERERERERERSMSSYLRNSFGGEKNWIENLHACFLSYVSDCTYTFACVIFLWRYLL